jgi:hypothetical protein
MTPTNSSEEPDEPIDFEESIAMIQSGIRLYQAFYRSTQGYLGVQSEITQLLETNIPITEDYIERIMESYQILDRGIRRLSNIQYALFRESEKIKQCFPNRRIPKRIEDKLSEMESFCETNTAKMLRNATKYLKLVLELRKQEIDKKRSDSA